MFHHLIFPNFCHIVVRANGKNANADFDVSEAFWDIFDQVYDDDEMIDIPSLKGIPMLKWLLKNKIHFTHNFIIDYADETYINEVYRRVVKVSICIPNPSDAVRFKLTWL